MKDFFSLKQVMTSPGETVRALRTNFQLTLKDMEKVTGISESNLSAIERNRLDIGVKRAVLIAAAFGIEPAALLFPPGYQRPEYAQAEKVRTRAFRLMEKKLAR